MARNRKPGRKVQNRRSVDSSKPRNGKYGKDRDIDEEKKPGNDPAWYASNPVILRDAASYPFSYNTGATEIHDPNLWNGSNIKMGPLDQIPGICSLRVYPVIGTAANATDPINVASQSVYSFVRHANSGHSNYDAPDLMLYILAMANMYSYLVFCQRLYGYALTYDQRNRYIPNDLLRTNNVDASDLVNNLANFRFWINTLIAKMVSFAVPATMSIFSRMSFIYSDYYVEGTSIKEQLYQYVPEGFYKFGLDSDQKGQLIWTPFDYTTLMTTADLMQYGDDLFDAIWSQEDFGIMSGDILKAYGSAIIKLQQIPEYYNIVPKFDPMVLTQMKNADITRVTPANITQNVTYGIITQAVVPSGISTSDMLYGTTYALASADLPKYNAAMVSAISDYRVLTVDTDDPTPDIVIEATRLKVGYDSYKGWFKCGTEIITKAILTNEPGVDTIINPLIISYYGSTTAAVLASYEAVHHMLNVARNFHYLPRIWMLAMANDTGTITVCDTFDIDNFTLLTYEDVRKLHEAATVNMFAVPSVGKVM